MVEDDELLEVVRRVIGDDTAELTEAAMDAIGHERVIDTTGGLYLGHGSVSSQRGHQPWSAVLKVLRLAAGCTAPGNWCYWKREAIFYGMPAYAHGGAMRTPRCYLITTSDTEARIWLEHLADASGTWTTDHFHRVAQAAGEAAGRYLSGMPLPSDECFVPFLPSILASGGWWATYMDPQATGDALYALGVSSGAWSSPVVEASFDARARARVLSLWTHRQALLEAIGGLPRVLCHNDLHRRNVLLPQGPDVVAIDWAFCGPGAAGADLADLVWATLYYGDVDVSSAAAVEDAALQGYVHGLRRSGWNGPPQLVRLAYLLATALRWAALLPGWLAYFSDERVGADVQATFGRSLAQLRPVWLTLSDLTLDRADEARR